MRCYTPCIMTGVAYNIINQWRPPLAATLLVLLAACAAQPPTASAPVPSCPVTAPCPPQPPCPVCPKGTAEPAKAKTLEAVRWLNLPGWTNDDPRAALPAFLRSCIRLSAQAAWRASCARAAQLPETASVREFFETEFLPYRVANADGSTEGLATGYYEPLLRGSRSKEGPYRYPLYATPEDLLIVDLAEVSPTLKHLRLRGRLEGRRVVPYYPRAEIEHGLPALAGKELLWIDDPVDLFFLQIQGSGRVRLPNGELVRVGYADQNGQPYKSIGRYLVEQGELKLEQASMQGIKDWAAANPEKLVALLNQNPSYVFFREMPAPDGSQSAATGAPTKTGGPMTTGGPVGALGVALTPERSIAVDPRYIPLGAPVYVATTWPGSAQPLVRLMQAQDSGGAIRGAVRADFFWGFGDAAGALAGRMRQSLKMWVLLPRDYPRQP
ncbi:MAG: murein transglycosylase A [Burkholderiales bacterium]|nr:murein transglycosylase A [Burkholderiales bacterium]